MNSFRGSGIYPLNCKAISDEKLIPASLYSRNDSDGDSNESDLVLPADSSLLDTSTSASPGSASVNNQIDLDTGCNPSTSSGSSSMNDQVMDIDVAREELVEYEVGLSIEDLFLQYIDGSDVDDPAGSQWIFLKSRLEHLESLTQNQQQSPILAPSPPSVVSVNLRELEKSISPEMQERFEKRLAEGFDLDTDPLYSRWKQLKTSTDQASLSEPHCSPMHSSPKPIRVPLAPKQVNCKTPLASKQASSKTSPMCYRNLLQ